MKASTKKNRLKTKRKSKLPAEWSPQFLADVDGRYAMVQEIRRRIMRLKQDTNCDSMQKELLVSRAVFLSCQLETLEVQAVRDGELIDFGSYTQACNALQGLLGKLGLEKAARQTASLKDYITKDNAGNEHH